MIETVAAPAYAAAAPMYADYIQPQQQIVETVSAPQYTYAQAAPVVEAMALQPSYAPQYIQAAPQVIETVQAPQYVQAPQAYTTVVEPTMSYAAQPAVMETVVQQQPFQFTAAP